MAALAVLLAVGFAPSPDGDMASLEAFIEREMHNASIPGLSVATVNATHVLWTRAFGFSDPAARVPAHVDTLFTFASISKTVISFVAMHLFEQQLFALDDDVDRHLDFSVRNPHWPAAPLTMRMLLSHTASIDDTRYYAVYDEVLVRGDWPGGVGPFLQALLTPGGRYYASSSWHAYAPGARFDYSNIGATLAAHVCECLARRALAAGRDLGLGLARDSAPDFNALAVQQVESGADPC